MATNLTHSEIEEKLILKEITKLLTSRRRLWFLEECLRINLTPNTLKVLPPNRGASLSNKNTQNTYKNAAVSACAALWGGSGGVALISFVSAMAELIFEMIRIKLVRNS